MTLSDCSYYVDKERQKALESTLATHLSTQQTLPTKIAPAQYIVCDSTVYPCQHLTPLTARTPINHNSVKASDHPHKQLYQNPSTQKHRSYNTQRKSSCGT